MNKIKIYTDVNKVKSASKRGYIFPLVELLVSENEVLSNYYEIVSDINKADFFALPLSVEYLFKNNEKKYFNDFLKLSKSKNKKLLVFTSGDYGKTVKSLDVILIRLGGFESKMNNQTYIMSPFIKDPYSFLNKDFSFLRKKEKPSIGFVGHSNGTFAKIIKEFLLYLINTIKKIIGIDHTDYQSFYPSSYNRHKILSKIQSEKQIISDFVFRKKYRAGVKTEQERYKTSLEFFENIYRNPYTFCMRGGGNFSVRFFETLAMGRIPVLFDTDCRLPFHNIINWSQHCLIIKDNNITKSILEFHNSFSEDEFIEIQKKNRVLWSNYFSKEAYFKEFYNILKK